LISSSSSSSFLSATVYGNFYFPAKAFNPSLISLMTLISSFSISMPSFFFFYTSF